MRRGTGMEATMLFAVVELDSGVACMWENRSDLSSHITLAVGRQLKNEWDAPTVWLVLCRDGNRTVVEYALSVTDKPMGVVRYRFADSVLPLVA